MTGKSDNVYILVFPEDVIEIWDGFFFFRIQMIFELVGLFIKDGFIFNVW